MDESSRSVREAIVVGGGPVGLFLALSLAHRGIEPRLLERRARPRQDSRSIGLHPPTLERLDEIGLGAAFVSEGVRVEEGLAFASGRLLGRISFRDCPGRHRYVLTLPQHRTEALLRRALAERAPGAVSRDCEVSAVHDQGERPCVEYVDAEGEPALLAADVIFDCEGKGARLADGMGIAIRAHTYPGDYAMADGPDRTDFGRAAAVFLHPRGQVESFPLPGERRRWVALLPQRGRDPVEDLVAAVASRAGQRLDAASLEGASHFVAERRLAARLARGRVALVGDAAHVVSPIGGQGTNLGVLGASAFVEAASGAADAGDALRRALRSAAWWQRRRAGAAAKRAEIDMWIGRRAAGPLGRVLVQGLLHAPTSRVIADSFTMRGLWLGV